MHRVGPGTDVWSCKGWYAIGTTCGSSLHRVIYSEPFSFLAWLRYGRKEMPRQSTLWFLNSCFYRLWKYYRCSVVSERLFKQLRNLVDVRSIGHRTWRDGKNKLFLAKMIPRQTKPTNQKKYMFIFPSFSKTFLNPPRMGTTWQPPHVSDSWLWHEKIFGFVHCFESLAWRLYLPALCLRLGA